MPCMKNVRCSAGKPSAHFWVDTYPATQLANVHLTASSGGQSQTVTLTLRPPSVAGVVLSAYSWVNRRSAGTVPSNSGKR